MQIVGQYNDCIDCERMSRPRVTERTPQQRDVLDKKPKPTIFQIYGEEVARSRNEVAPIICHHPNRAANNHAVNLAKTIPFRRRRIDEFRRALRGANAASTWKRAPQPNPTAVIARWRDAREAGEPVAWSHSGGLMGFAAPLSCRVLRMCTGALLNPSYSSRPTVACPRSRA